MAGAQRGDQIVRHDTATPGDVDEVRAALHFREEPRVEHALRVRRLRRGHDDEVGLAQPIGQPVGREEIGHAGRRHGHAGIGAEHGHAQRRAKLGGLGAGSADTDDQHGLAGEVDHPRALLPLPLRQVVLEPAREREQERDGVRREVLVVAAAHVRDDHVALHERVVEPVAAQAGARRTDPGRLLGVREQLRRYRAVGGIGVLDLTDGFAGIAERLDRGARHGPADLLRPRLVDVGREQQNLEAHGWSTSRTIFPVCASLSMYLWASVSRSNGNVRSSTGLSAPLATASSRWAANRSLHASDSSGVRVRNVTPMIDARLRAISSRSQSPTRPPLRPTLTSRALSAITRMLSASIGPPTWSMITSTPRPPVARITASTHLPASRVSTTSWAPSARSASALAGVRVVAITGFAPMWRAIWIAAVPTPDGPAVTITASPGRAAALVTSASCAVTNTLGIEAASAHDRPAGIFMSDR